MDRNFHTDDFERLLREKSDEFRMYPSKRIWHSVYNNIHPGRKWPSVAMSITLITALFLIGYLNTKNTNSYTEVEKVISQQNIVAQINASQFTSLPLANHSDDVNQPNAIRVDGANTKLQSIVDNNVLNESITGNTDPKSLPGTILPLITQQGPVKSIKTEHANESANSLIKQGTISSVFNIISIPDLVSRQIENVADEAKTVFVENRPAGSTPLYEQKIVINNFVEKRPVTAFSKSATNNKVTVIIQGGNSIVEKNNLAVDKKNLISTDDRNWIENYALYNRPATKKWANKLTWQLYVTPSVVYRTLYEDPNFGHTATSTPPLALSANNQDINKSVNQKPSVGLEIGTGLLYSISKTVKLKVGLQVNYTRYNSDAFQNTHPVATQLTMHDYATNSSYEEVRTTPYSNKSGIEAIKLHNETFQLALPMGADLMLIGNKTLQWNFGATIQPTYVFGGKSYLISSDRRNYIKETSMLNKWNLNAGFETFISYKASNGITFQLGPQFRTQLFTTNHRQIAVEEKLNTYGLKFGITKTIK